MPAQNADSVEQRPNVSARTDTLALLYQSVFTGIVRLQSGRQALSDTVRRRITDAIQDVQMDAGAAGYKSREVRDAESAVVAFLDETVLSLQGPQRDVWAKQTLSMALYGESNAGEVFYDRLEDLIGDADSNHLADLLEVYLLCLLLGFEGKYSGPMRAQATLVADRLRKRIEAIRGGGYRLSPPLRFAQAVPETRKAERPEKERKLWLAGLLVAPILVFLLFKLNLWMRVDGLVSGLREWR